MGEKEGKIALKYTKRPACHGMKGIEKHKERLSACGTGTTHHKTINKIVVVEGKKRSPTSARSKEVKSRRIPLEEVPPKRPKMSKKTSPTARTWCDLCTPFLASRNHGSQGTRLIGVYII